MEFREGCRDGILYLAMILALLIAPIDAVNYYNCSSFAPESISCHDNSSNQMYTILRPTLDDTSKWIEMFESAPPVYLCPDVKNHLDSTQGAHITLLSHMNYTPSERDQGTCGNCWAWAGTGILEIALDTQLGIKDRLSMQYINTNYNGGNGSAWACCGGWLEDLIEFYNSKKILVPWSNTNAQYEDGLMTCERSSNVSSDAIATNPHYSLTSVRAVTIPTRGIENERAIANIKNVLGQGKGVWFGFFLPNQTAWNRFFDFWGYQPECTIWQPEECQAAYSFSNGGGHAALCVGYNDEDPKNRYWIMLNSWGVTKDRPDGLFMVSMDMNYSCAYPGLGNAYYWMTLEADFDRTSSLRIASEKRLADARDEARERLEDAKAELDEAKADIDEYKKNHVQH
ncbi:MAG: hypothetical protein MUE87_01435 [Methanothrix sp.]|nr:hypothetical protein [Methanothrix sp.]